MPDRIRTRFLVVGSGVAGLHTAWRASNTGPSSSSPSARSSTRRPPTRRAGSRPRSAPAIRRSCIAATHWQPAPHCATPPPFRCSSKRGRRESASCRRPVPTSTSRPNGAFELGKEAAHSRKRIVHAHGDQTGAEVARTLVNRVRESPGIQVMETTRVLDLIIDGDECVGVRASVAGPRRRDPGRRHGACDRGLRPGLPVTRPTRGRDRRRLRDRASGRCAARGHGVRAVPSRRRWTRPRTRWS